MPTQNVISTTVDDVIADTLRNYKATFFDNWSSHNNAMKWLHAAERVERIPGGHRIERTVEYGENATWGSYSGYDPANLTPQQIKTNVFYDWAQNMGTYTISNLEKAKNAASKFRIRDLLASRIRNLEMSGAEETSRQMWAITQAASTDLISIPMIVNKTDNSLGTIDGSVTADSYWNAKRKNSTAGNGAITDRVFRNELYSLYNDCSKGAFGKPTVAIGDQASYEAYELGLDDQKRYTSSRAVSFGFEEALRIKSAAFIWDERVPDIENGEQSVKDGGSFTDGSIYLLNERTLFFTVHENYDFEPSPLKDMRPQQDASAGAIYLYAQLTCGNRAANGVMHDINASNIS